MNYLIIIICGIFLLVACQPRSQEFKAATVQPALVSDAIIASDGEHLRLQQWLPKSTPKAIILALHGFNDYSNTFQTFGEYATKHAIAVYAYDQRGYGKSAEWGIWAGEENLVRDLADAATIIKAQNPDIPLYIAGESMGGAVVILAASQKKLNLADGLILFAPAIWGGENMYWWYRAPLWLGAHLIPYAKFSGRGLGYVPSDNEEMLLALGRDPLIIKRSRTDSIYGVSNLMNDAYNLVDKVKLPTLMLYGANDDIIPANPSYDVMLKLQANGAKIGYYPNGYHMLTRDLQQDIVHRDVVNWVLNKSKLPSGADADVIARIKTKLKN